TFSILTPRPPTPTLFPYTTLFRSSVAVVEDATRNRTLRVNNHFQMGGTGAAEAEYRHAHIPLLLHPAPRNALVLGVGTGITLGRSEEHTSELQSQSNLVCRLLLEK